MDNSSQGIIQPSQPFNLIGTTGKWAGFELDGDVINQPGPIPCESYDCVRACYQANYPKNFNNYDGGDFCAMKSTFECSQGCSGTTFTTWEESDDGIRCIAAQASSSSKAATQSQTSTSSVSPKTSASAVPWAFTFTQVLTTTRSSSSSSTSGIPTFRPGQIPKSTDTSTGAARATAVPSLAPASRASLDVLSFIGTVILGVSVAIWS